MAEHLRHEKSLFQARCEQRGQTFSPQKSKAPPGGGGDGEAPCAASSAEVARGDTVTVEVSVYDLTKGRITWRKK